MRFEVLTAVKMLVLWVDTKVSEEYTASIFRVEVFQLILGSGISSSTDVGHCHELFWNYMVAFPLLLI
jgi:hypothetical protein